MIENLIPTPSQTVGPFFHLGLTAGRDLGRLAGPDCKGERIRLVCRVLDVGGLPVDDALVEIWQADAEGNYVNVPNRAFRGFGRLCTDQGGVSTFETVMPGRVEQTDGAVQAPHINVLIFARGLLKQLATRIYFTGAPGNGSDPILQLVPEDRRDTLMAHRDASAPRTWNFEIRLAGDDETVFFDI